MFLQNEGCYQMPDGTIVRAQVETGGVLAVYSTTGSRLMEVAPDEHVEGWVQVSKNVWGEERKKVRLERQAAKKSPEKRKTKGKKVKKEEKNEEEEKTEEALD